MSDDTSAESVAALLAEVGRLRKRLEVLESAQPGGGTSAGSDAVSTESAPRRQALGWAGAAAVGVVAGAFGAGRPAAAADPNDVVKNVSNPVTGTTELTGSVGGPLLRLTNSSTSSSARGLIASSGAADVGAIRGDNTNAVGIGGVGVGGYAPGGRDFLAFGSGRIAMNAHSFTLTDNTYTTGEIHQTSGTLWLMVSPTTRRSLAGPKSAGAFYPLDPARVYDSRRPAPSPGRLTAGSSRVLSVADARSTSTGAVTVANVVPAGATAVAYNLTVTETSSGGYLAVASGSAATYAASAINWSSTGQTLANASVVPVSAGRQLKVFCPSGSTHVIIDVVGYYL